MEDTKRSRKPHLVVLNGGRSYWTQTHVKDADGALVPLPAREVVAIGYEHEDVPLVEVVVRVMGTDVNRADYAPQLVCELLNRGLRPQQVAVRPVYHKRPQLTCTRYVVEEEASGHRVIDRAEGRLVMGSMSKVSAEVVADALNKSFAATIKTVHVTSGVLNQEVA